VKEIGIFGSTVKRESKRRSDIDILLILKRDLVGLSLFLERRLKQKVDVVPKRTLRALLSPLSLGSC
jgi:predicted nucleotidyltransferase